jgi:hypothetical protein
MIELGDAGARAELLAAREGFRKVGNQLGDALVAWDLARLEATTERADGGIERARWHGAVMAFANLGLTARVAQVLADLREHAGDARALHAIEMAVAAAAQEYAHLRTAQEVELVLTEPSTLAEISTRRVAGQRNLGRLAAHTVAEPGLAVAAIAAGAISTGLRALPSRRSAAALVGQLPGVALWVWHRSVHATEVARDLSSARVALGDDTRVVLGYFPEARIVSAPLGGELGAELSGADLSPLIAQALADPPARLRRLSGMAWDGEAEALARMSGLTSPDMG